jgi:hypothetical protein
MKRFIITGAKAKGEMAKGEMCTIFISAKPGTKPWAYGPLGDNQDPNYKGRDVTIKAADCAKSGQLDKDWGIHFLWEYFGEKPFLI